MKYFVDTNIFLRTLVKEDEKTFSDCVLFLKSIKENKIKAVTSTLVLAEIMWTLQSYYEFPKEDSLKAFISVTNLRGLKIIDHYDHLFAYNLYQKYSVKFIDTLIVSIAQVQTRKMTIVSYDHDFDKLGVLRKEPQMF